jgi:hypothetical protein
MLGAISICAFDKKGVLLGPSTTGGWIHDPYSKQLTHTTQTKPNFIRKIN